MNKEQMRIAIAEACGRCTSRTYTMTDGWETAVCNGCGKNPYHHDHEPPDYPNDLNAMAEAEKLLDDPKYSALASSHPQDHAPHRYLAALAEICGLKTVEELVLSCDARDRGKLNFRPGPYPTPIKLPPSAIILGHSIPAYGYELCLIRATAEQRAEAFLKTVDGWVEEKS